jgi:UDP-galactopyranose mutase
MVLYDYLVVGSGLCGAVFAHEMHKTGKKVLVLEKRHHIGGNVYDYKVDGITVSRYGPHYFHTNNIKVWQYINQFATFYNSLPRVKVNYQGRILSFPINLMTLNQLWGVTTPTAAQNKLQEVIIPNDNPTNLEEYILSKVGQEIYDIFFKGYTAKQWGCDPKELPASIIKRIPIRLSYDDNYHQNCKYQGMPINGYTEIISNLLKGIPIWFHYDFNEVKYQWQSLAKKLYYTGSLDDFFDYEYGRLDYRSLRHQFSIVDGDFQGAAQINYTDIETPYTRILEFKHMLPDQNFKHSVICKEYPQKSDGKNERFYPIDNQENSNLYKKYANQAKKIEGMSIGGRLGLNAYIDMDQAIALTLNHVETELKSTFV